MKKIICLLFVLISIIGTAQDIDTLEIYSNASWKATSTQYPGWQTTAFDESSWPSATSYPNQCGWTPPVSVYANAYTIWAQNTSANIVFFKIRFTLADTSNIISAFSVYAFDDDGEIYINDVLVYSEYNCYAEAKNLNLKGYFKQGENVISVKAQNCGGCKMFIQDILILIKTPDAPLAIASNNIGLNGFTARWNSVNGAKSYRLDLATDTNFTSLVSGYSDLNVGDVNSYVITGLDKGTKYYYRVRASNGYTSDQSNTIVSKTLKDQTISGLSDLTKTYGDNPFTLNAVASSGLPVNYFSSDPNVVKINENAITIVASGTTNVSAVQEGNVEYGKVETNITLTVSKAPLKLTADDQHRLYGSSNPALTISYNGFVNGDDVSNMTEPQITTTATSNSAVGNYEISISGGSASNYLLELENGNLYVQQAPLFVSVNDVVREYGEPNPAFTFTYYGFVNGDDSLDLGCNPSAITSADILSQPGNYQIEIIDCGFSNPNYNYSFVNANLTVALATAISLTQEKQTLNISPNPTNGNIVVKTDQNTNLNIYNSQGRKILDLEIPAGETNLSLDGYPSGFYFIHHIDEKSVAHVYRVIKR